MGYYLNIIVVFDKKIINIEIIGEICIFAQTLSILCMFAYCGINFNRIILPQVSCYRALPTLEAS